MKLIVLLLVSLTLSCANIEPTTTDQAAYAVEGDDGVPERWHVGDAAVPTVGEPNWLADPVNDPANRPVFVGAVKAWPHSLADGGARSALILGNYADTLAYSRLWAIYTDSYAGRYERLRGATVFKLEWHKTLNAPLAWWSLNHLWFANVIDHPELVHQGTSGGTGDVPGRRLLVAAASHSGGPAATSVQAGSLYLRGGKGASSIAAPARDGDVIIGGTSTDTATTGNIALNGKPTACAGRETLSPPQVCTASDWAGGQGVVYLHNATAAPTAADDNGGYLYACDGGLCWRGSAGTITQVAPP